MMMLRLEIASRDKIATQNVISRDGGCDTDLKMWRILLTGDQVRLQVDLKWIEMDLKFGMEVATENGVLQVVNDGYGWIWLRLRNCFSDGYDGNDGC
ncbi:hypothetical protein Hanom_Chr12g01140861 [Helianthus anomalus]